MTDRSKKTNSSEEAPKESDRQFLGMNKRFMVYIDAKISYVDVNWSVRMQ